MAGIRPTSSRFARAGCLLGMRARTVALARPLLSSASLPVGLLLSCTHRAADIELLLHRVTGFICTCLCSQADQPQLVSVLKSQRPMSQRLRALALRRYFLTLIKIGTLGGGVPRTLTACSNYHEILRNLVGK